MAELIPARGNRSYIHKEHFTVDELQNLVDGWIGILPALHGVIVFDVDGQHKDKYLNFEATRLVKEYFASTEEEWDDYVAGDALLVRREQIEV